MQRGSVPLSLTHEEEDRADQYTSWEHVLGAGLLGRLAHGPQLVGQRVRPEVGQQQAAEEEEDRAVAGAAGRLHLGHADGLHVEVQDHHREDDHGKGQDEGWPRIHLALNHKVRIRNKKEISAECFAFQDLDKQWNVNLKIWQISSLNRGVLHIQSKLFITIIKTKPAI